MYLDESRGMGPNLLCSIPFICSFHFFLLRAQPKCLQNKIPNFIICVSRVCTFRERGNIYSSQIFAGLVSVRFGRWASASFWSFGLTPHKNKAKNSFRFRNGNACECIEVFISDRKRPSENERTNFQQFKFCDTTKIKSSNQKAK